MSKLAIVGKHSRNCGYTKNTHGMTIETQDIVEGVLKFMAGELWQWKELFSKFRELKNPWPSPELILVYSKISSSSLTVMSKYLHDKIGPLLFQS